MKRKRTSPKRPGPPPPQQLTYFQTAYVHTPLNLLPYLPKQREHYYRCKLLLDHAGLPKSFTEASAYVDRILLDDATAKGQQRLPMVIYYDETGHHIVPLYRFVNLFAPTWRIALQRGRRKLSGERQALERKLEQIDAVWMRVEQLLAETT